MAMQCVPCSHIRYSESMGTVFDRLTLIKILGKLLVKYVSTYIKGTLQNRAAKVLSNYASSILFSFFFSDFLYKSICCGFSFELNQQVDARHMGTHNKCLYKEVGKKYTGCNVKTTELLDCAPKGVCVVIRSNTVYWDLHLLKLSVEHNVLAFLF